MDANRLTKANRRLNNLGREIVKSSERLNIEDPDEIRNASDENLGSQVGGVNTQLLHVPQVHRADEEEDERNATTGGVNIHHASHISICTHNVTH